MIVAFDNGALCLLLHPDADVPNDPETDKPIERAQERVAYLVEQLREADARILIPAPVLSEFLTFASSDYLDVLNESASFAVAPFDQMAAIEAAALLRRDIAEGRGKRLGSASPWQKIKVDRQIVAIARVGRADVVYSTDKDVLSISRHAGLTALHVADLPLPPSRTPLFDRTGETE